MKERFDGQPVIVPQALTPHTMIPFMMSTRICIYTQGEEVMPTYHVEMLEGRTIEQKRKLVQEITRVTVEVLGGSPDSVDVLITDVKRENWATGGKLWTEPRS
jgi:4-oxalocrotonate tautomerase